MTISSELKADVIKTVQRDTKEGKCTCTCTCCGNPDRRSPKFHGLAFACGNRPANGEKIVITCELAL